MGNISLSVYMLKDLLLQHPTGGGMFTEGFGKNQGWQTNYISAHTKSYSVGPVRERIGHVPEMPGADIVVYEIPFRLESFAPLADFKRCGIRRVDTMACSKMREQEKLRHLYLARVIISAESWALVVSELANIYQPILTGYNLYRTNITTQGRWTHEQFLHYALQHASSKDGGKRKGSRSVFFTKDEFGKPHFLKWDDIAFQPDITKSAFALASGPLKKEMLFLVEHYKEYAGYVLDSAKTGPAIRPREATLLLDDAEILDAEVKGKSLEVVIVSETQFSLTGILVKWRARKAGSQGFESLAEWPIFDLNDIKRACLKPYYDALRALLVGVDVHFLVEEGLQFFLNICEFPGKVYCYDLKNSEKQIGLLFTPYYPLGTDMSHPDFPLEFAPELYSGRSDTGPWSEAVVVTYVRALIKLGYIVKKLWLYRDGFAVDINLKGHPFPGVDDSDTIAGFRASKDPLIRCFGPISFLTDSPDTRVTYDTGNEPHRQTQMMQHWGRVMQAIVLDDIAADGECYKFLKRVAELQADVKAKAPWCDKSPETLKVLEALHYTERHHDVLEILSKFPQDGLDMIYANNKPSADYVAQWYVTQRSNIQQQTDRVVTNGTSLARPLDSDGNEIQGPISLTNVTRPF